MTSDQITAHYRTLTAAAQAIGRNKQTVSNWFIAERERGEKLPLDAQVDWEVESAGKLRADLPDEVRNPPAPAAA